MERILWDDDPDGNVDHVFEHGLAPEDVEHVLNNPESAGFSRSSDRPCVFGYTEDGRHIIVIYEQVDEETVYPVTAYDVPEP